MKYLSFIIVPLFVGIFTPLILNYIKASIIRKEAHLKPDDFQISSSPGLTISLLLLSVVSFVVWLLIWPSNTSNVALNVLVPITIFIFVIFAYITIRTKIIVKRDDIVVTPIFGKKRLFYFHTITKIKKVKFTNGNALYLVYIDDKYRFFIDASNIGATLFIKKAIESNIIIEEM